MQYLFRCLSQLRQNTALLQINHTSEIPFQKRQFRMNLFATSVETERSEARKSLLRFFIFIHRSYPNPGCHVWFLTSFNQWRQQPLHPCFTTCTQPGRHETDNQTRTLQITWIAGRPIRAPSGGWTGMRRRTFLTSASTIERRPPRRLSARARTRARSGYL